MDEKDAGRPAPSARPALRVGALTAALAVLWLGLLVGAGFTPMRLMFPGEDGPSAVAVEERFGPDVLVEDSPGYDGQQLWVIATRFPDLDAAVPHVDDARYRFQRILTPALASVAGDGEGPAVVLLLLGVVGVGIGGGALADLAARHGRPAWVGLAFFFPVALAVSWGLSDAPAFGLGLLGVALVDRRRYGWASVAFVLGALAREPVAFMALAAAFGVVLARQAKPREVVVLGVPVLVVAGWMAFLAWQFPVGSNDERFGPLGLVHGGLSVLGVVMLVAGVLAAWTWRDVPAAWPVGVLFAVLTLGYGADLFRLQVVYRAAAPAFALALAGLLAAAVAPSRARRARRLAARQQGEVAATPG